MNSILAVLRSPLLIFSLSLCGWSLLCPAAEAASPADAATVEAPAEPSTDAAIYGEGVRSTPWQTPAQQRDGFHLPSGFEVRLFASEPQIAKPLNLAADARGRLWVTQSSRYPYPHLGEQPADDGAADAVVVLEDADGDGYAEHATTFADGLNIPIGVLPYGEGCLCFSIPHIWYLRDTDGDGRCDRRDRILGPFDTTRDTHGMVNSLRDGNDGWIYACHGFNNQSTVAGTDGHSISMSSGNTFRFRPDGSRVEQVTQGQVNPFGMTIDDWGYRYSADCHSKPITQLIQGACYPSFGRPHDGLGFLPPMVDHLHGSTAISGIVYVSEQSPLVPLRGQMISGNVMTSRLNRNRIHYHGATASGEELPDFLTSDDPWFRPADIQIGPDGHLYVADFYNRIIGHYEVPLEHPGRDRTSGRIWQIRYAPQPDASPTTAPALATAPAVVDDPVSALTSALAPRRRLAMRTLLDQELSNESVKALASIADSSEHSPWIRGAAIEVLAARAPDSVSLADLLHDSEPAVRLSVLRATSDPQAVVTHARQLLDDPNAHVARLAAERLGQSGQAADIEVLLSRLLAADPQDHVLRQTIRIAIAQRLRHAPADAPAWAAAGSEDSVRAAAFVDLLPAVDRAEATAAMLDYLASTQGVARQTEMFQIVAARATADQLDSCVQVARRLAADNVQQQLEWLELIWTSQNPPANRVPDSLRQWAAEIADNKWNAFLAELDPNAPTVAWNSIASSDGGARRPGTGWPAQPRQAQNGTTVSVSSSIMLGEQYTGTQRTEAFNAPAEIRFWIAGHNGFPTQPSHDKNRIRLVDAQSGSVLEEAFPPRSDVAVEVHWNTARLQGQQVQIECIDGDDGAAYAWLAVGAFQPARLNSLAPLHSLDDALHWIERAGLKEQEQQLIEALQTQQLSPQVRLRIAQTIASLRGHTDAKWLLAALAANGASAVSGQLDLLSEDFLLQLIDQQPEAVERAGQTAALQMTLDDQQRFALQWVRGAGSVDRLLAMGQAGWLAAEVFADEEVWQSLEARLRGDQHRLADQLRQRATSSKTPADEILQRLQTSLGGLAGDPSRGQPLYKQHCAACHQLRGEGVVIGPQLDGAAPRPLARLLEDVLTPNRNVDHAFRTTSFLTEDGQVVVGLVQSETETAIQLIDSQGKPQTLLKDAVEVRKTTDRSLMPSNFGELMNEQQLADLLAYLKNAGKSD